MPSKTKLSLHTMPMGDMMKKMLKPVSLPMATLGNLAYVEIRGKNTLGIENHKGILQYCTECIIVSVKNGTISAVGRNLQIIKMDSRRIEIVGELERVELS